MEPYLILKFIHVLLAITAVGSNIRTASGWGGRHASLSTFSTSSEA